MAPGFKNCKYRFFMNCGTDTEVKAVKNYQVFSPDQILKRAYYSAGIYTKEYRFYMAQPIQLSYLADLKCLNSIFTSI